MTQMMRAVEITKPGGPDVLQMTERPVPEPAAGQVILKVAYAGVNRPDALQRAGAYDPPPGASDLPGLEASGEVVASGLVSRACRSATRSVPCCRVAAMPNTSPRPPRIACRCLQGMGMKEAACLPETFFTVWSNVFTRGGLKGR